MATRPPRGGNLGALGDATSKISLEVDTSGVAAAAPALASFTANTNSAAVAVQKLQQATVAQATVQAATTQALAAATATAAAPAAVIAHATALNTATAATQQFGFATARSKTELIVLLHELSQDRMRQFGGSLLVLAEQTGIAAVAFTAAGATVAAFLAPLAALAFGYIGGAREQKHFTDELFLSGNAAGVTAGQYEALAHSLANSSNQTSRSSKEVLDSLIQSGKVGPELLQPLASSILNVAKLSGQELPKVTAEFLKMVDGPTKFALETDKAFNVVNVKLFEQIRYLEEHGQKEKATLLIAQAYSDHLTSVQAPALDYVSKLLRFAAGEFDNLHSALFSIGKDTSAEERLDKIGEALVRLKNRKIEYDRGTGQPTDNAFAVAKQAGLQQEYYDQLQIVAGQKRQAAYAADATATQQAGKRSSEELHTLDQRIRGHDRLAESLAKLAQNEANETRAAVAAGDVNFKIDQKTHDARVRQLELDNQPRNFRKQPGQLTDEGALKNQIDGITRDFKVVTDQYKNVGTILAAENAAGLTDAKDYFSQLAGLATGESEIEILALQRKNDKLKEYNNLHKSTAAEEKNIANNNRDIVRNEQQIQDIRNKTATQLTVIDIQTAAYLRNLKAGYVAATQAAEENLKVVIEQHNAILGVQGLGTRQTADAQGQQQINEKARAARQQLEDQKLVLQEQGKFGQKESEDYTYRLSLIDAFQSTSLSEWKRYFAELTKSENDWTKGATRALADYVDQAGLTAANTNQVFTKAFKGMEDALTSFVTTGKGDFKGLINSIIADIVRLSIQQSILKPLGSYLQTLIGGIGGSSITGGAANGAEAWSVTGPGEAIGGSFGRNSVIPVNEKGPEVLKSGGKSYLLAGDSMGQIVSNPGGGGSGSNVTINIASGISRNEVSALIPQLTTHIANVVASNSRRPGYAGAN